MAPFKKWTYTTGGFPQCLHQTTSSPPAPSDLTTTQIQVRIKAFAINPVDVQAMNLYKTSTSPYPWPLSLFTGTASDQQQHDTCCDFSGTITHAGPNAGFVPGDDVFGFTMAPMNGLGTAAEVLTLDTASASVAIAKKPAGWDHAHAAAIPLVWLTARVSIESVHANVEQQQQQDPGGKWLVVLGGSSATGMYTIRIAKARGWKVLATCSTRNVEFVKNQLRADEVVDYTAVTSVPGEIFRKLQEPIQKGDGVVIVDCVGGTDCLYDADLGGKITRYVTIVGDKTDRSSMGGPAIYANHPKMLARWALGKVGLGVHYDCVILDARKEWLEEAGETLGKEEIIVDSTFKFDDLPKALAKMVEGKVRGKLVGVLD
ncbi:unnamed protein product [Discula destructiva]